MSDAELPDWPERYRDTCLRDLEVEERSTEGSPVRARFRATTKTPDGLTGQIEHFLLRLPRR